MGSSILSGRMPIYKDYMAEWLRRWTANPLGSARAGSNPADVAFLSLMVQWLGFVSFTHAARVRFPVREKGLVKMIARH